MPAVRPAVHLPAVSTTHVRQPNPVSQASTRTGRRSTSASSAVMTSQQFGPPRIGTSPFPHSRS